MIVLWHGCSPSAAISICKGGVKDLRTTDGGYFGSGIYLTPNLDYAIQQYSSKCNPDNEGNFAVLLCKAGIARTYPISRATDYPEKDVSKLWSISTFHSAHPIPKELIENNDIAGIVNALKTTRLDKSLKPGFDSHFIGVSRKIGYQAAPDSQSDFYELVVKEESQVLPIGILYFKKFFN